jgi:UDPglucose 6-dehydrogenase
VNVFAIIPTFYQITQKDYTYAMKIGFIGQGWIGKNYANDFESRGYEVIRYALEEPHINNKEKIAQCDIVFIAVPTPTKKGKFDDSLVRGAIKNVGKGKIAVIKSTILPGTTTSIQKENPDVLVLHSPEFLQESTAAYDASHPQRNIVGIPENSERYQKAAESVLSILPDAPYKKIMDARDAEFVKYAGNCFLFTKVIFMNLLYNLVEAGDGNWPEIRDAFVHDPRIGTSHTEPVHKTGRGAGGNCFIKDFEAFRTFYEKTAHDPSGMKVLDSMKDKNIELLEKSNKDIELIRAVYGNK